MTLIAKTDRKGLYRKKLWDQPMPGLPDLSAKSTYFPDSPYSVFFAWEAVSLPDFLTMRFISANNEPGAMPAACGVVIGFIVLSCRYFAPGAPFSLFPRRFPHPVKSNQVSGCENIYIIGYFVQII